VAVAQGLGLVVTAVIVYGLAWLRARLNVLSLAGMLKVALAAWLFFDFTTMAIDYLYVGQSGRFVAINMGYQLIAYALAGLILGALPPKTSS
jgi:hypothetical protein